MPILRKKSEGRRVSYKYTEEFEDEFWFDQELLASVVVDEDGEYCIKYNIDGILLLGAVKLLLDWEQVMYDKYKRSEETWRTLKF